MARDSRPPRFKPFTAPRAIKKQLTKTGNYRGTAQSRGYDAAWNRLSIAYRKKHPFCLFCTQRGRETLTDLVDHMIPAIDRPDLIHAWDNLCALCRPCHGQKAVYERRAREMNCIEILPQWVKDPSSRPSGL